MQVEHSTRLEAEYAELRAELDAALSAKLVAEAALTTTMGERGVCAAAANAQLALAAEEADRAKETGIRLLELADHAALVAAAYEVGHHMIRTGTEVACLDIADEAWYGSDMQGGVTVMSSVRLVGMYIDRLPPFLCVC